MKIQLNLNPGELIFLQELVTREYERTNSQIRSCSFPEIRSDLAETRRDARQIEFQLNHGYRDTSPNPETKETKC